MGISHFTEDTTFASDFIFDDKDYTFNTPEVVSFAPASSLQADHLRSIDLPNVKVPPEVVNPIKIKSFQDLKLSRQLLKAITSLNYNDPTPVQSSAIPHILNGRDICACASTGTGKTAAFILPILERLLYKPVGHNSSRVLVLVPTRELGLQVYQVTTQLSQFIQPYKSSLASNVNTNTCGISLALCVGGLDIRGQEASLRSKPDIIIATPGRLIDHLENAPSFSLDTIEILVLDEADRMLDEFFAEQMTQILKNCAENRQVLLFSATLTDKVKDLARLTLQNPVRLFVDSNLEVARNLTQEFVRIREQRESDREAILVALLTRNFTHGVIVFVQTKLQTHRLAVLLNLIGLKVGELHGNLKQLERMESLKKFKEGQYNALICTDLASRGLDIEGVQVVINFTLPNSYKHYIHRVGRTARAGKEGRAISLVGDQERNVFRDIIKNTSHYVQTSPPIINNNDQKKKQTKKRGKESQDVKEAKSQQNKLFYRKIDTDVITDYKLKLEQLESKIQEKLKEEKMDKDINVAQLRVYKAEKMIKHHDEIMARPKRKWFQTHGERILEQKKLRLDEGDTQKPSRKKKKPLKTANSDDDDSDHRFKSSKKKSNKIAKKSLMSNEERIRREITKAKQYALKCLELNSESTLTNGLSKGDKPRSKGRISISKKTGSFITKEKKSYKNVKVKKNIK